jgi:amino acid adenylation domain-containing protein
MHGATELIAQLRALDVHLRVEDGRLRVNAPKGGLTPELEAALVERKSELLEILSARPASRNGPRLVPVPRNAPLALSFLQERLWVLHQIEPAQTAYNLASSSGVVHDLDLSRLERAIRRVIERHEILRARFAPVDGEPRMHVVGAAETPVVVRDLESISAVEQAAIVAGAAASAAQQPFDLAHEAPVRFTILRTGPASGALVLCAHHIAMDSWSMGVLTQEIMNEYAALADGSAAPVAAPKLQYADFSAWQRASMAGDGSRERLDYWTKALAGLPQLSTFRPDHARQSEAVGAGATYDFYWSPGLYQDIKALARELDATVYMVMLAAMTVVLCRNTGQSDVAIGSPIGTREPAELETVIGPILNPLVLRFNVADDPTFAELVTRARSAVLDGHTNQQVPFELIVQTLKPDRSLGHSPLFQVAVVLHNAPNAGAMQIHGGGSIYDVTMFAVERQGVMTGALEYRSDLYDAPTIARIDAQIQALLHAAVRNPATTVSMLPLLTDGEIAQLVKTLTPAPVVVDRRLVTEQFATAVATSAQKVAVSATDEALTYSELDRRATLVAQALMSAGAGPGSFVALATDRSSAMIVGALGILKAGAAYVPLDTSYPADRVAFMLNDSGARHIVSTGSALRALGSVPLPPTVVLVEDVVAAAHGATPAPLGITATEADMAYMIYTSGSTGVPKGVRVPHRALSNFLGAMRERPGISAGDAVLCLTSMSFDISVLEIFLPLVVGARTIVVTRDDATDGARLASVISSQGATIVQATPSGWRLLMNARWTGGRNIVAIAGGETMPPDLARWLGERVREVWNGYGPTETTVYSTMALLRDGDVITIGTPVANTHIYVLDSVGRIAPIGVPGELCIGGDGVTDGYHNRPELTAESFVADSFVAGRRMYRTGDYGRWRTDGRIDHLGRIDGQVKLRGYRIETAEIEAALATHPAVRTAVVGVRNASADDPRLVAWVQLHDDEECTSSELRRHLRQSLPEFMIPGMLLLVDSLPLTPNAKIDRRALPDPFGTAPLAPREYAAPTTPTQRTIAEIWIRLLGVKQAGLSDSFFELGGHSLLAMRAASEISLRTGRTIEPRLLFFRTLGQLAEVCDTPAPVPTASRS